VDFWNGLGEFFATFEPKDWVTAIIALLAIAVSVFTASQTWRYHPKPLFVIEHRAIREVVAAEPDPYSPANDGPKAVVTVANRGSGIAHDVRLVVEVTGSKKYVIREALVEPGKVLNYHDLTLGDSEYIAGTPEVPAHFTFDPERVDRRSVRLTLRWRQSPLMWLRRKSIPLRSKDVVPEQS
jgi:hypothetical protein